MNILFVTRSSVAHQALGGMEQTSHEVAAGLAKRNCSVITLTTSLSESQKQLVERTFDGVKYLSLPTGNPRQYSIQYHRSVKKWLHDSIDNNHWVPDVIHSVSGGASSLLRNTFKIPVIATWYGTQIEGHLDQLNKYVYLDNKTLEPRHVKDLLLNTLLKELSQTSKSSLEFNDYSMHIAISEFARTCISMALLAPSENKVRVIPQPLQPYFDESIDSSTSRVKARKILGIKLPEHKFCIGVSGRLVPEKGHQFLAEALKELDSDQYSLLILGDGPLRAAYENLKHEKQFMLVKHKQMPYGYCAMDVLINPTVRYCGFDLTLQECLSSGTPYIVSDLDQYSKFRETLSKATATGAEMLHTFRISNQESLLSAINRVRNQRIKNQESTEKHTKCIQFVRQYFNSSNVSLKYLEAFKAISHSSADTQEFQEDLARIKTRS